MLDQSGRAAREWARWYDTVYKDMVGNKVLLNGKFVVFDKASGNGIKINRAAPDYGWHDLLGQIRTRGVGATDPADATYRGNIKAYLFSVNDEAWLEYHIPHDYAPGTDMFIHFHWSHNDGGSPTGGVTWGADITYAKGFDQAPFTAPVTPTIQQDASTTQYQHMIAEVQMSATSPSASQIETDNIEVDGVILVRAYLSAETLSGGVLPFLHFVDIHYQSTGIATKGKAPDFYA